MGESRGSLLELTIGGFCNKKSAIQNSEVWAMCWDSLVLKAFERRFRSTLRVRSTLRASTLRCSASKPLCSSDTLSGTSGAHFHSTREVSVPGARASGLRRDSTFQRLWHCRSNYHRKRQNRCLELPTGRTTNRRPQLTHPMPRNTQFNSSKAPPGGPGQKGASPSPSAKTCFVTPLSLQLTHLSP